MPKGRIFQGTARMYGPAITAALMEDKSQTEATPVITYKLSPEELEKYRKIGKEKGKC